MSGRVKVPARALGFLAAVVAAAPGAPPCFAQDYPSKSVKIIVPFGVGGPADLYARVMAQYLQENLKQSFVVEPRPGAGGVTGTNEAAKSAPDGYTLLMGHVNSHGIAPNLFKKLPYDAQRDFAMIAYVGYVPNVLVVHPSIPAKNVNELVALAKAKPGTLTYASSGIGSTQHLAGEMMRLTTGVNILHVPYKGSGQAIIDLLAGHVAMNFDTMPPILNSVRQHKLRALAVTTPKRAAQLADTPTMLEVGLKGFEMTNWYGVMGPAAMNKDNVAKLNAEINRIMAVPDTKAKLEDVGTQLNPMSTADFASFLASEIAKYAKLVKAAGVSID